MKRGGEGCSRPHTHRLRPLRQQKKQQTLFSIQIGDYEPALGSFVGDTEGPRRPTTTTTMK